MDRFGELESLVAVADHGGFAAAARRLGLSPPGVTRAIAGLERRLGVSLFRRTTRSVALTDEGAAFLVRAREVLAQLGEAEHEAMGGQSTPSGELHVTAPVMFGRLHVMPPIAELLATHSSLRVRLMLLDRNIRLVEEGIDVAVRIGPLHDSGLRAIPIGSVRQILVASPAYCAARGRLTHPSDLVSHEIIGGDNVRGTQWRFGPREEGMSVTPRLTVTSVDAQLAAAEAGLGITNVLSYQAADAIASGRLSSVLDAHAPPALPINLLLDATRARMPSVRLFAEAMRRRAKALAWS